MRISAFIVPALVTLLLALTGGVYAYDSSRKDVIAADIRIGSVDVGGLDARQARRRVAERLLGPLREPLVVRAGAYQLRLTAKEARIGLDVAGHVAEALRRGREGGILARSWRNLTGARLDVRIAPDIVYSRGAVQRLVDRVRVKVRRSPDSAEVKIATTRISMKKSMPGRAIDAKRLRARVARALVSAGAPRSLRVGLKTVRPRVSSEDLAHRYATVLTVDRRNFRLRLFKNLELAKTYPIAVGKAGVETPAGLYRIQNKAIDPAWQVPDSEWAGKLRGKLIPSGSPDNPIKARWLGVYDGVGVHGTDDRASIGSNASHGCIRMYIEDVKELYDRVPVGTAIKIA